MTLERFQMQFPIKEKEQKVSYDDWLKKKLHGVPISIHRLQKQPIDGKSFHYVVNNITNNTFLEIMHTLESRGYLAGITRVSKRGKKVDLVDKLNDKMGITLEENSGLRIVKIILVPMEK